MLSRRITMTTRWQNSSQGLCDGLTLQYPHRLIMYLNIWFPAGDAVRGGCGPAGASGSFDSDLTSAHSLRSAWKCNKAPFSPCPEWPSPPWWAMPSQTRISPPTRKPLLIRCLITFPSEAWVHLAPGSGSAGQNQIWKFSFYSLGLQTLCSKKHLQSPGTPSFSILATINNQKQSPSHLTYINHSSGRGLSSAGLLFPR